ncbi:hypothetical protein [Anaerosolibacter sp.]|uniref:hypothetical protein n=1 Tax=Anaerosolibacter sp. TaxID=1872527 RepID=UPI0039F082F0
MKKSRPPGHKTQAVFLFSLKIKIKNILKAHTKAECWKNILSIFKIRRFGDEGYYIIQIYNIGKIHREGGYNGKQGTK